jgi:hypothetical protein
VLCSTTAIVILATTSQGVMHWTHGTLFAIAPSASALRPSILDALFNGWLSYSHSSRSWVRFGSGASNLAVLQTFGPQKGAVMHGGEGACFRIPLRPVVRLRERNCSLSSIS